MTTVEGPKAETQGIETDLEKAQRLSGIVKKYFPVPPNASKASFFFDVTGEGEEKSRNWKLTVNPNGRFRIEDVMPIPNSLSGGGFIDQYSVNPNGDDTAIFHKNNRLPPGNPEDVESVLKKLLPKES